MREVVSEPIHLPGAEQGLARRHYLRIAERELSRRFFQHDLPHIGWIDRNPAKSAQEHLSSTVLRLAHDFAAGAEALVAELGGSDANAIDIARGQADRARQPDIERVQVRTLAAKISSLQHRGDVADAAAARLRIAERIIDDPLVNAPRLLDVTKRPADDAAGSRLDDAVSRHQVGRRGVSLALAVRLL